MSDMPVLTIDSTPAALKPAFEDTCKISWTPTQDEQDDCELEDKLYCVMLRTSMTSEEFCAKYNMKPSSYCLLFFAPPEATNEQAEQGVRELMDRADELEWYAPAGIARGVLDMEIGAETH